MRNKWLDFIVTVLALLALIVGCSHLYHTHPGIDLENHPPAPACQKQEAKCGR